MKIGFPLSTVARNFNKVKGQYLGSQFMLFPAIKKSNAHNRCKLECFHKINLMAVVNLKQIRRGY